MNNFKYLKIMNSRRIVGAMSIKNGPEEASPIGDSWEPGNRHGSPNKLHTYQVVSQLKKIDTSLCIVYFIIT